MRLQHLVLLITLLLLGLVMHQFYRYLDRWDALSLLNSETRDLASQIENTMYEERQVRQQFAEAERQHQALRQVLPQVLDEKGFEQQLSGMITTMGHKILALKVAIYPRSAYREAVFNLTIETTLDKLQPLREKLTALPRIVTLYIPEQSGKQSVHLDISIYAAESRMQTEFALPPCQEPPGGIWLPPLKERIASLHAEYAERCRYANRYGELYRLLLQGRALQEENRRLQLIVDQLRSQASG